MKKIERRAVICAILALFLVAGLGIFLVKYLIDGGDWASSAFNRHLYDSNGVLATGTVLDRDGDILSSAENGKRAYYENEIVRKATLHAVGDLQGNIGTGALNAFADELTGYSLFNGAFGAKHGGELYLTIDARYNYEAYQALGGRSGTVAVYNYKTGEILCMVSAPSYDPLAVPPDIETNDAYKGAYLNRFLSSTFTPGSVYKTVTLAAALEQLQDVETRVWTCQGSEPVGEETIVCSGTHGEQSIGDAFANSCNVAFAQIAELVGKENMEKYVYQFGITESLSFDGVKTVRGNYDVTYTAPVSFAWSCIGQYTDLVNPAQFMRFMGAVAGGGTGAEPYIMAQVESGGNMTYRADPVNRKSIMSKQTAETLQEYMRNNVISVYGSGNFPGMTVCAKSGTSELGGDEVSNAMFAGFVLDDQYPLAFIVVVENGGFGSGTCVPIISRVLAACREVLDAE